MTFETRLPKANEEDDDDALEAFPQNDVMFVEADAGVQYASWSSHVVLDDADELTVKEKMGDGDARASSEMVSVVQIDADDDAIASTISEVIKSAKAAGRRAIVEIWRVG